MLIVTKLPLKYIFRKTWGNLLLVICLSTLNYFLSIHFTLPNVPIAVPALLGTAISLVLAFKLSQSYDRWWEARKIWGAIVNDSRSFAIQVRNLTSHENKEAKQVALRMINRQIAWNYALGDNLRKLNALSKIEHFISGEEYEQLKEHQNVPFAIIDLHSKDLHYLHSNGFINDYQQIQIDQTLVRLVDSMGRAERIKGTIFPTTYRLYLHLFILLFLAILSESLAELEGLWQPVVVVLVSLPFLLLERTAYLLQDPFENRPTDTSMTAIARTVEINLKQISEQEDVPDRWKDEGYFIM